MNCKKCGGLMVNDADRENPFGSRCVNCGYRGGAVMAPEKCNRNTCEETKANDSVFCGRHRDMNRAANQKAMAKKNERRNSSAPGPILKGLASGVEKRAQQAAPLQTHPANGDITAVLTGIDSVIARYEGRIKALQAAKAAMEE